MRQVLCTGARARDHALLVLQQRVEFFAQWRDLCPHSLRVDALRVAAPHPFQLYTEAVQRTQAEVHLAGQHRQPRCDQHTQRDGGALPKRGNIGIQRAAVGGDHGHERFTGTWQAHLLHACAQGLLQRPGQVAGGRPGNRRRQSFIPQRARLQQHAAIGPSDLPVGTGEHALEACVIGFLAQAQLSVRIHFGLRQQGQHVLLQFVVEAVTRTALEQLAQQRAGQQRNQQQADAASQQQAPPQRGLPAHGAASRQPWPRTVWISSVPSLRRTRPSSMSSALESGSWPPSNTCSPRRSRPITWPLWWMK